MTVTAKNSGAVEQAADLVTVTIDGIEVSVPKGTLAIRAAEKIGIAIPRFCDHPLLDPAGACRECLVDVPDMGNGRGMPKPQPSCTLEVAPGMKINTQLTSPVADKAQRGMIEFLLINHPLDCPICDKGGECPLQNQAMSNGRGESRYEGVKRTYPKPVSISTLILLDRERCILCQRCTRFAAQIAGDPLIDLVERGALQQIGIYEKDPYNSYFSGNVIQICPVGALTSSDYRFQSRPFDLVSTTTSCEHCAGGCELRVDHRHFQVKRRMAGDAPEVNEEWNCDVGRFAFLSARGSDRVTRPLVRKDGLLVPASWPEAIDAAVTGLRAAATTGVLTGGRLTVEAAYAYAKFARTVLRTNDIDFRTTAPSTEEDAFLAHAVAGASLDASVTYSDLERASHVVLVAYEPEEDTGAVFLRLRKAVRKKKLQVTAIAPYLTYGNSKLSATLIATAPGGEVAALDQASASFDAGTVILVGQRAAAVPGLLSAVVATAGRTGARFAWIPGRAGDVGAVEAGCLPGLLPGGRPVSDPAARVDVAAHWGSDSLPSAPGRSAVEQLAAVQDGTLGSLLVSGLELADFPDPQAARAAVEAAGFVVSLENRLSDVASRADVVLPVALLEETSGTFYNWEHRVRPVNRVIDHPTRAMTDIRVLAALADALGADLGFRTPTKAWTEFSDLSAWEGAPAPAPATGPVEPATSGLRLATWRTAIDDSRHNDGADHLLSTARPAVAIVSPVTAAQAQVCAGDLVSVATGAGWIIVPLVVDDTMVDGVVWVPQRTHAASLPEVLEAVAGDAVTLTAAKDGGQA